MTMTARQAKRARSFQENGNFAENPRALSSVHTLGITRPPESEDPWLSAIGEATKPHRLQKARKLDAKAAELERAARLAGESDERAKEAGRWHRARARGQRRRIETVRGCRKERAIRVECGSCGQFGEQEGRCGVGLLCVSCRGKRARKKRGNFARSREVVIRRAAKAGLLRGNRHGGRWSEKLLTLTGPHRPDVDLENRIEIMRAAWPHFIRKFKSWLRASREAAEAERVAWFRNFEWEPSSDGRGHPHIHVWIFCPFLDREMLLTWWRDALLAAGYLAHEVSRLIVDVRAASTHKNAANEVIKYLTKDITREGLRVDPKLYGRVCVMLDGARTTQSSRGFMGLAGEYKPLCDCGCSRLVVRIIDLVHARDAKPQAREARAPP